MLIELKTIKGEPIIIALCQIEIVTPTKKGILIVLADGLDFEINSSLDEFKSMVSEYMI